MIPQHPCRLMRLQVQRGVFKIILSLVAGQVKPLYMATKRTATLNDVDALIIGVGVTGTSEKLRLQDDGKLGLGVTPTELFHAQDTTNPAYLKITGPDAGFAGLIFESPNQLNAASINYDTSGDIFKRVNRWASQTVDHTQ